MDLTTLLRSQLLLPEAQPEDLAAGEPVLFGQGTCLGYVAVGIGLFSHLWDTGDSRGVAAYCAMEDGGDGTYRALLTPHLRASGGLRPRPFAPLFEEARAEGATSVIHYVEGQLSMDYQLLACRALARAGLPAEGWDPRGMFTSGDFVEFTRLSKAEWSYTARVHDPFHGEFSLPGFRRLDLPAYRAIVAGVSR